MNGPKPRALLHRGAIGAAGFYLDAAMIGDSEARQRILALWTPGSSVYRIGNGFVIRLASPVRVECDRSPGAPLIEFKGSLYAAPFGSDELKFLDTPTNSLVLVRGGEAVIEPLLDPQLEAIENWIQVNSFVLIEVNSLGLETMAPSLVAEKIVFDPRTRLEGVLPESPGLAEVITVLRSKVGAGGRATKITLADSGSPHRFRSSLVKAANKIGAFLGLLNTAQSERASRPTAALKKTDKRSGLANQSFMQRLSANLRGLQWRLLLRTRVSNLIGGVQARYLGRLMEMFESGDLKEALRHAIPLGGEFESQVLRPALWAPAARDSLRLSPSFTRARSVISLGDALLTRLRDLYRASFDQFVAQGRIEEAAFVLAELLHANEEAVAFLERHGRLQLAAEMAEARDLAPGLVVRQWFVAGDVERAILIARKTAAFSDAIVRLERGDRKLAEKLRLLWSAALADAGDYVAAVDAIWPVSEARRLALNWLDKAIELGGPGGARALARKVGLAPEEFDTLRDRVAELLEDEGVEGASSRVAFAEALRHGTRTTEAKTVARMAVRALLRDSPVHKDAFNNTQFRHLIDFTGDGALRADVPRLALPVDTPLNRIDPSLKFEFAEGDRGSTAIRDSVFLPNGRALVALGEAGVLLLNREGKTIAYFDQPAERLVVSEHSDRAIAMARRGDIWRLARLDLMSRHAKEWCEARIDAFASDYDGSMWFIGAREDFYAIDVNAKRFDALWRVPDVGGAVVLVARSKTSCRFVTAEWGPTEEWVYDLPSLRLRVRTELTELRLGVGMGKLCLESRLALASDGGLVDQSSYADLIDPNGPNVGLQPMKKGQTALEIIPCAVNLRLFRSGTLEREMRLGEQDCVPAQPAVSSSWVVSPTIENGLCRVRLIDREKFTTRLDVLLGQADAVAPRLTEVWLSLADDRGRLLVFDLSSGRLIRNLRV